MEKTIMPLQIHVAPFLIQEVVKVAELEEDVKDDEGQEGAFVKE